jgi:triosephosphate isomerase
MNFSLSDITHFVQSIHNELSTVLRDENKTIILCPSYPFLHFLESQTLLINTRTGAQNCSEYSRGAHTGQVSAAMLADSGCDFCIIGHNECRSAFSETNLQISQKIVRLIEQNITPIICVGETEQNHQDGQTKTALTHQLTVLFKNLTYYSGPLLIAYEPIWAIGTGSIPTFNELECLFEHMQTVTKEIIPQAQVSFIYGGSVTEDNAQEILKISTLSGLLIGGASLDFKKFKKIVSLAL